MRTQYFPAFFDALVDQPRQSVHSQVEENEHGYFIQLDAPGIAKEDLKISAENRYLVIEGERKGKIVRSLRRVFTLPDDVDTAQIAAQMKDGVLELVLPKKEQAKPKLIPVQEAKEGFFQRLLNEGKAS